MNTRETLLAYGLEADPVCIERLDTYRRLLREWNKNIDLTSVPDEETNERHFADSLLGFRALPFPLKGRLADVGTGAGFPGLPLAIWQADLEVTLIDALEKRCAFLRAVCEETGLTNVRVLHLRAEDAGRSPELRERFDFAVARAVAPLNVLCEYLLPLVRLGGQMVCWKGPKAADEMEDGSAAAKVLGGGTPKIHTLSTPMGERLFICSEKVHSTPSRFPRKSGTPSKKPLQKTV